MLVYSLGLTSLGSSMYIATTGAVHSDWYIVTAVDLDYDSFIYMHPKIS